MASIVVNRHSSSASIFVDRPCSTASNVVDSRPSSASNRSTAELFDSGNLMLNNSGVMAWQSFDHPCDTYLPGMKVGLDLITNVNQVFTSWRSEDDPAPGNFSIGIAPDWSTQFFIWEGNKPWWRSGR
ncbi:hypothetical protein KFK09_025292 [Dendrobium nobile]|uniref:Bulb-type lectin domain-containing protein n=1 Tax=Dendrobium nobile TaxID=94219 RepID=A0A8T3AG54_DENNO|nr:hypothetical protein KFK09_025292 [Dendrobium nobile]